MPQGPLLLKGGTLLLRDENERVKPTIADLLVENGTIAKIGHALSADANATVIDCKHKIVSPGFIDTHRHMWQTLIKGKHGDQSLLEYFPSGNMTAALHTPADLFWAQLSSCLEAIDAGTTTVLDHAHCLYSAQDASTTLQATIESGIRSVYCYSITPRTTSWNPLKVDPTVPDWAMETFFNLASKAPFGDGRVTIGFGFDTIGMLPPEDAQSLIKKVRDAGSQVITMHGSSGPRTNNNPSMIDTLEKKGVLGRDIVVSHSNFLSKEDLERLEKYDAFVSTTPSSELQMGLGELVSLTSPRTMKHGSLGIDSHCLTSAFLPLQMNLALQAERAFRQAKLAENNKWTRHLDLTVEEVFNLGTLNGARACGMEGKIGVIKEGARADLVIFDGNSPGMLAAAATDPVVAIVLHSSIRDIDCVIVDGIIRKQNGKLNEVEVDKSGLWGAAGSVTWDKVSEEILTRRKALQVKMEGFNLPKMEDEVMDLFRWDKSTLAD